MGLGIQGFRGLGLRVYLVVMSCFANSFYELSSFVTVVV